MLFRSNETRTADNASARREAGQIVAQLLRQDDLSADDKAELSRLVASNTGLSSAEAGKRVDDVLARVKQAKTKAQEAADAARKATAQFALWSVFALLLGAFTASYLATVGGRLRDQFQ